MRRIVTRAGLALAMAALMGMASTTALGQGKQAPLGPEAIKEKIAAALPDKAPATPKQPRKLLIYSKTAGFRHGSIKTGIQAITMLGDKTGAYTSVATEDESYFEPEKLKAFDAVLMLNTTLDCLRPKDAKKGETSEREEMLKKSFIDYVSSGKGLAGIHAAGDTYHDWKEYTKMMGATFQAHPWTANSKVSIKINDPKSPVNAAFDGKGFDVTDEIYVFRPETALPTGRRYLLSLDDGKMDLTKGNRKDGLYPISWISTYGKGHTFYCSLGHNDHIYWNPAILKHYLAGIQYAFGDLQADSTPIPVSGAPTKSSKDSAK